MGEGVKRRKIFVTSFMNVFHKCVSIKYWQWIIIRSVPITKDFTFFLFYRKNNPGFFLARDVICIFLSLSLFSLPFADVYFACKFHEKRLIQKYWWCKLTQNQMYSNDFLLLIWGGFAFIKKLMLILRDV